MINVRFQGLGGGRVREMFELHGEFKIGNFGGQLKSWMCVVASERPYKVVVFLFYFCLDKRWSITMERYKLDE